MITDRNSPSGARLPAAGVTAVQICVKTHTHNSKNTRNQNNMFIQPANGTARECRPVHNQENKKTTYSPNTYRRQRAADQLQRTPTEDLAPRLIGRLMNLINADCISVDNRHAWLLLRVLR